MFGWINTTCLVIFVLRHIWAHGPLVEAVVLNGLLDVLIVWVGHFVILDLHRQVFIFNPNLRAVLVGLIVWQMRAISQTLCGLSWSISTELFKTDSQNLAKPVWAEWLDVCKRIVLRSFIISVDCLGDVESWIDRVIRFDAQFIYVLELVGQTTNHKITNTLFLRAKFVETLVWGRCVVSVLLN